MTVVCLVILAGIFWGDFFLKNYIESHVDAPVIDELPLALECKLVSYDEETRLLTGEIVNVSVDERALDENGKLAVEKLHVITFDYANHGYYVLGEKVASAFEDGKKFK